MSGNTKDKIAVRNNAGKTTPAATTPMANTYANAIMPKKIEKTLPRFFANRKCYETSLRFLCLNIKENDKFYQIPDRARTRLGCYVATELKPTLLIVTLFVSSQSEFPLRFYVENKQDSSWLTSTRYIATCQISSSLHSDLSGLKKLLLCVLF
ncbi:hypothetical protein DY000_02046267 [Brassica cretica]|uniref:Uncharacterized protein n=1 Tax=Brassica cretica TaxID=69181 RepID=A0ABQ7F9L4_BRACR|nr:hypothetical protein DY000_02046267 [Brassica cretica]